MTDTEIVPRKRDREPVDRAPLVDAQRAEFAEYFKSFAGEAH